VSGSDGMEMGEYTYRVVADGPHGVVEHFYVDTGLVAADVVLASEYDRLRSENRELRAALERYRERMP
jgi:hypothetical protein